MVETPDPCLAGKGCNQHCRQGRDCPAHTMPAKVTNVRRIHPHIHARDDAWLTTPAQLERTEDERTGRVLSVYDAIGTTGQVIAVLLTIVIVGIASGYVATRWGDTIGSAITSALQAWGRVWT